jgi:hypothetical protein
MMVLAISRVENIGIILEETYLIYSKPASFSLKFPAGTMWDLAIQGPLNIKIEIENL